MKIRRTLIGGDRQMVVYDDLEPSEKVRVYDRGVTVTTEPRQDMEGDYELLVAYRTGDMHAPRIAVTEALRVEAQHFIDCIRSGRRPLTDGLVGLRVIRVLEAAERSVADRGRRVNLE